MIKLHRIQAFLLRHWYETLATVDRKVEIVFWPTIDLLIFGLFTVYMGKLKVEPGITEAILGGLILWTLVYNIQRDITISLLEEAWSRNLYNLFSSPFTIWEMIIGTFMLSFLKAIITITFLLFLSHILFGFNLLYFGLPVAFFVFSIFMFGWAFGYITSFFIFRFGTRVQTLAWSLVAILYPLSGVFYPLNTLPSILEHIARLFPISYIFESLRALIISGTSPSASTMMIITLMNLGYLVIGILLYVKGFKHAKKRGWFIHPS